MSPTPFLAPSLVKLRSEVNALWPERSKKSDGWIGDAAHAARKTEHNPDAKGCVHAIDVTSDTIDPMALVKWVTEDPHTRAWYVIFDRKIYSRKNGWKPEKYTGASAHTEHVHISILLTEHAENDVSEWIPDMPLSKDDALKVLNTNFARNLNGGSGDELTVDMKTFAERTDQKLDDLIGAVKALTAALTPKK